MQSRFPSLLSLSLFSPPPHPFSISNHSTVTLSPPAPPTPSPSSTYSRTISRRWCFPSAVQPPDFSTSHSGVWRQLHVSGFYVSQNANLENGELNDEKNLHPLRSHAGGRKEKNITPATPSRNTKTQKTHISATLNALAMMICQLALSLPLP